MNKEREILKDYDTDMLIRILVSIWNLYAPENLKIANYVTAPDIYKLGIDSVANMVQAIDLELKIRDDIPAEHMPALAHIAEHSAKSGMG